MVGATGPHSWLNSLTNPNAPILMSRFAGSSCYQYAWTGEIVAAAVDGSNTVWRFAHNRNSGVSCYYGQAFAQISNDGKWALFSSHWDGTLGDDTAFGCSKRIDTFIVDLMSAVRRRPVLPVLPRISAQSAMAARRSLLVGRQLVMRLLTLYGSMISAIAVRLLQTTLSIAGPRLHSPRT